MAETVCYQQGMHLGRTFDLKQMQPGLDIFPEETLTKSKTTDNHQTSITYSVIENNKDVKDVLGVDGAFSLKVKAGLCKVSGKGEYLKTQRTKDNAVEILASAHVETLTETLTDTKALPGWRDNVIGTHYIRSVTYGGDMIASIRIEGNSNNSSQEIKAKVQAGLTFTGVIDVEAKGKFKQLEEDLKSVSKITISYFSTSLQGRMPRDINGMLEALDGFKDQVRQSNDGRGVPLTCELLPLNVLDSSIPRVLKNKALDIQLTKLDDYYEDVLQAKTMFERAVVNDEFDFNRDDEGAALSLEESIDDVLDVFNRVIANLDITTNGEFDDLSQIAPAFEMYKKHKKGQPGPYRRKVARFLESLHTIATSQPNQPEKTVREISDHAPDAQAKIREAEKYLSTREQVQNNFAMIMESFGNFGDLLSGATPSIAVLSQLVLSTEIDVSLIGKHTRPSVYLSHPTSLRASIRQICRCSCEAFSLADKNMEVIRHIIDKLPTDVHNSVKIIFAGTTNEMEISLPKLVQNTKRIATDCKQKVQDVERKFIDVMNVIGEFQELCACKQMEINDFETIIISLIQGISHLREHWGKLMRYFQMVGNILEGFLDECLYVFLECTESGQSNRIRKITLSGILTDVIFLQASKTNLVTCVVQGIAGTYAEVSEKHILRHLSGLYELITLDADRDKRKIKELQRKLQQGVEDAAESVNDLVRQRHDEIMEKGYEKIINYEKTMREALPPFSAAELREATAKPLSEPLMDIDRW